MLWEYCIYFLKLMINRYAGFKDTRNFIVTRRPICLLNVMQCNCVCVECTVQLLHSPIFKKKKKTYLGLINAMQIYSILKARVISLSSSVKSRYPSFLRMILRTILSKSRFTQKLVLFCFESLAKHFTVECAWPCDGK